MGIFHLYRNILHGSIEHEMNIVYPSSSCNINSGIYSMKCLCRLTAGGQGVKYWSWIQTGPGNLITHKSISSYAC